MSRAPERFLLLLRPIKILPFICGFAATDPVREAGAAVNPHDTWKGTMGTGVIQRQLQSVCRVRLHRPSPAVGVAQRNCLDRRVQSSPRP